MHDIVEILHFTKLGGPIVLVVAIIAGLANASGGPEGEKMEKFLSAATIAAFITLVIVGLSSTQ
ncbi:MAG: hypothetical protein ABJA34_14305 [Pseudonocardiales bacterium]